MARLSRALRAYLRAYLRLGRCVHTYVLLIGGSNPAMLIVLMLNVEPLTCSDMIADGGHRTPGIN